MYDGICLILLALNGDKSGTGPIFAEIAQVVEHQLPKLRAAGSNPVFRSNLKPLVFAAPEVEELLEHFATEYDAGCVVAWVETDSVCLSLYEAGLGVFAYAWTEYQCPDRQDKLQ